jgi:hypothetical protein
MYVCVCMYACMYACMYVCMHVCMHAYIYIYIYMYIYIYIYICIFVYMHAGRQASTFELYTYKRVCLCMYMYMRTTKAMRHAAILIIIEGRKNGIQRSLVPVFTTGKPLKSLKLTLNYDENGSTSRRQVCFSLQCFEMRVELPLMAFYTYTNTYLHIQHAHVHRYAPC